jgi:hypothetical protein
MATPKWWKIVLLVNNETIFVPIVGDECVTGILFHELPDSMKTGFLKHVENWSDYNKISEYFDNLVPIFRWREIRDIYKFFLLQQP